jgi:hypothetical protein
MEFIRKNEKGDLDIRRSREIVGVIAKAAMHHKDDNLLIDIRETETKLNFVELLTVALEFAEYEDIFRNRIAFLIPNNEERIRRAEYVKKSLVGVRGFTLDYFTEYEKAIDWLSSIKEYPE